MMMGLAPFSLCSDMGRLWRQRIKVQICPMGPVIGSHTGPGFAAIIHFGNRNFR